MATSGIVRTTQGAIIFLIAQCLFLTSALAQEAQEYRMEIGAGAGLVSYQGDFNGNLLRKMQPTGGLVAKYKMNPRMAWAASLGYGTLKGESTNGNTWYPGMEEPITFSTTLVDFDVRYEYNFWAFGTGREYHGAKPFTPFITLGMGLSFANCNETATAFQMPIGFGVKYKLKDRLNLAAEWMMHFTGSDKLDGVEDPYGIMSTGLFKNTDSYSVLRVTLTYDIWAKCKTCHNDKD